MERNKMKKISDSLFFLLAIFMVFAEVLNWVTPLKIVVMINALALLLKIIVEVQKKD